MAEGMPTYQELVGRPALKTAGTVFGSIGGGLAGAATGPAAPAMIPLGRAAGAGIGDVAGEQAGNLIWGKPTYEEQAPWFETAGQTAATSLAFDVGLGALSKAGTYAANKYPEVKQRLDLFRKQGIEPLPSEITQTKGPALVEGAANRYLPTAWQFETRIAKRTEELRTKFKSLFPSQSGADVAESMEIANVGLKAMNKQAFTKADAEYGKLWGMVKPNKEVATPNLQSAAKKFKDAYDDVVSGLREEPAFGISKGVGSATKPTGGYAIGGNTPNPEWVIPQTTNEFTFNELKLMHQKLGEKLAGSSEMIAKGVQGTRGYGGIDTGQYRALRKAIEADITSLSPDVAAQFSLARSTYAGAMNTYEKKSVRDVLLAAAKENPELVVDRYFRSGRSTAIDNLRKAMPPSSFNELVSAKIQKEAVRDGVLDPAKAMKWLNSLDDASTASIFPSNTAAIKDIQSAGRLISSAAARGGNPSGTAQVGSTMALLGAFASAVATGSWKIAGGILGGAAGASGATWLYLRPMVNDMVAKGILQPSTARALATIGTGTTVGMKSYKSPESVNLLSQ
jgi:hypothetical protein